uniref:AP complex subunit sigma n=1 Tax=Chromera velia CCMP2878 TaxID=1169474 RepID=A0A0G4FBP7_9ALVE|eukprot:Cvel_16200.t1-p1 / transcript=Cvel_16200.t1 / gene=Cvel_16200 / organism=Chromera_velia_CCMP2878 / gene_product=AP-3 complex subunit sigma-2, putative / transcript_product=AP-3 complex subunit sigma-2, putative / location=Cvel_scaffold1237:36588-39309(+) / protein_length=142 / sequence_SO=supercontig / SO=protein_coding / is_pseudo=false
MRFYDGTPPEKQQHMLRILYGIVSKRSDDNCCCFSEDKETFGEDTKIVYRHYATLFFILVVDSAESELGILDLIQVFVHVLDQCFENVCELDLVYHFDKVNYILDEIIIGGMVLETNVDSILASLDATKKVEQSETSLFGLT